MSTTDEVNATPAAVLHAVWSGAKLHVFGIRSASEGAQQTEPAAPARGQSARFLPTQELHTALGRLSTDTLLATAAAESGIMLWLPDDNGDMTPQRRRVPTLALGPADAIDLLMSIDAEKAASHGDTLRYWRPLARFMLSQLSRQKICPDILEPDEGRFIARWRLLVHDRAELIWLERYVSLMPPACRAAVEVDGTSLDTTSIIESFLAETTDAVVRRVLAGDEFFAQIHRKARELGTWDLHWLASLIGKDPRLQAPPEDSASGAAQVRAWIGQPDEDAGPTPQLRFILREPDAPNARADNAWRLQFELRCPDTGETFDIAQVWAERVIEPTILGSHLHTRRQQLVSQLARAAELFPEVGRSLARAKSSHVKLSNAEAHLFLRERAPLLAAEGFDVELPPWTARAEQQLGLRLSIRPKGPPPGDGSEVNLSHFGLTSLLDFDWQVAVGETQLTLDEFETIASAKAPLVKFRDQWISLDHEAAERALKFMRERPGGAMTLLQAIRIAGGAEDADSGLPILGLSGADWLDQFLRETPDVQLEAFDAPTNFLGTLRPYQLRGLHWLAFLDHLGIGACLADDMGLGKTIQLIALLLHERSKGRQVGPTLLFAPMSVVGNWEREIERFAPSLRVLVHHGPLRLTGQTLIDAAQQCDVLLTTYGLAGRELKDFSRIAWHRIAMDEAQKIKNPTAQQTVALRAISAPRRVALTGTPVENHLYELWSIMEVLNPGLLGSATQFRTRFAVPIEKMGDAKRAEQLRRMIRPFVLRRLKSDPTIACDLPEKMEMRVYCNLTPEQAALYERTVASTLDEVDQATGIRRRGLILAALTRLKQICNHPAHFLRQNAPLDDRSGKCERLIEMLEEVLEEGDCALVFTQYREMGTLLQLLMQNRLKEEIAFLHGGTTMKKRQQMIDEFQNEGSSRRIFLLSLKAGGFGLNLTRANHVFHFDRWWNPAVEEQAADRVHRIGQTRRVQVHKFVCIGTVEERIDKLLAEKSALADRIVGSGDEWLTNLSTVELREHLALSSEAVAES